jgi:hypothetical protein
MYIKNIDSSEEILRVPFIQYRDEKGKFKRLIYTEERKQGIK